MEDKSKLTDIINNNMALSGKDQMNFQDHQIQLFGVKMEFLQKLLNKEVSEIAGSFLLLRLLL